MKRRRSVSPAQSENAFDIAGALAGGSDNEDAPKDISRPDSLALTAGAISSEDDDELYILAQQTAANRRSAKTTATKKAGNFQGFGLNANLLKAIGQKGYKIPTPIQRKTIPIILDGQDVVGMARTGSGKTAAFVLPMLQKLKAHSAKVGARAVILSPSRELALQTLKVVKELGKGTDLRTVLLVGGDSLEEQFGSMASNPDIVIATPGRFEHLKVEMGLELSSIRYVVFDEADRLFEMGFAAQLTEIIHSLPPARQTLLFSATLPRSLVEFARAGLQEPKLVRLDSESKISPDLQSAFFMVNGSDKEGALFHVLRDVIKMPSGPTEKASRDANEPPNKKHKRGVDRVSATESPTAHSTIVFTATKHHVDYLATLLKMAGYATSYVYGALDQTARKMQVQDFRSGMTNILVVTDVAARGIDIPILANVINYDFPPQPKVFVHRVGRTARAGRKGWSYNLVTNNDIPYLLDLQLFLGGNLVLGRESSAIDYHDQITLGSLAKEPVERNVEEVMKMVDEDTDLAGQRGVAAKGEKQYVRTRTAASVESAKRSKSITTSPHLKELHPLFDGAADPNIDVQRQQMLARLSGFRPQETVFEIGRRGQQTEATSVIQKQRRKLQLKQAATKVDSPIEEDPSSAITSSRKAHEIDKESEELDGDQPDSDSDLEVTITDPTSRPKSTSVFQDPEHFMGYLPTSTNLAEEASYSVNGPGTSSSFLASARTATLDLTADENSGFLAASKPTGLRWDKKSKRYVARANDVDGSRTAASSTKDGRGGKGGMIRGESGTKIPGSMKSGRFEAWKKANRVGALPKVGEMEKAGRFGGKEGGRYRHKGTQKPKEADRFRDDYYKQKKKVGAAREREGAGGAVGGGKGRGDKGRGEVRGVDQVRKLRAEKGKRKEKNARPSRKKA